MKLISRDPFARTELHRENEYGGGSCQWCGGTRKTKCGQKYLYRYFMETDGGRRFPYAGVFCSISCFRSYHA